MRLTIDAWGNSTYRMITPSERQSLGNLEPSLVTPFLRDAGVILFRGFDTSLEGVSEFVERNSARVTLDPARVFHAKNVQKVDAGLEAVDLHCENGVAPLAPEYIWFYCYQAAALGSQTTVCDGVKVWEQLSRETQALFSAHRIKYARTFPPSVWKRWVAAEHPEVREESDVTERHLVELVTRLEGQKVTPLGDGRVYTEFCVPALHTTAQGKIAFANSLLGPSYNYEAPRITTDDDKPIPIAVWDEVRRVTAQLTVDIDWQSGDVALIDNLRVMHGRRCIEDPARVIYAAMSTSRHAAGSRGKS